MSLLYYCVHCQMYTLKTMCSSCHKKTVTKKPPRFSPQDAYGSYRRALKKESMDV